MCGYSRATRVSRRRILSGDVTTDRLSHVRFAEASFPMGWRRLPQTTGRRSPQQDYSRVISGN